MKTNKKRGPYRTKKRIAEERRRKDKILWTKFLLWLVVSIAITIIATANHYIQENKNESSRIIEELRHPVRIEKAEAVSEPSVAVSEPSADEDIRSLILRIAKEENFKWPDYLVRLANCESRLDPNAKNDRNNKPAHSVDRGLFQINSYWHRDVTDTEAYNPVFATRWTIQKINEGKQHYWVCDKYIRANPAKYR